MPGHAAAGWILCAGWSGKIGLPYSVRFMGWSAAAVLFAFLLVSPLAVPRLRRRKQQIDWALSRWRGTHAS